MKKRYNINQSPLYKLSNKRKLAILLKIDYLKMINILKKTDNYRISKIKKNNNPDKFRTLEVPKPLLKKIHIRLFKLLSRIITPDYLHSGTKGKSYITNAKEHLNSEMIANLDISNFYSSTSFSHVYKFFIEKMKCPKDVSYILTKLSTCEGHIPTGSSLSQILSFFSNINMFNEINDLCVKEGLIMSCYVDDITISGKDISNENLYNIRGLLIKNGLSSNKGKEQIYTKNKTKLVTGVIIKDNKVKLPNKRHLQIYNGINETLIESDNEKKLKLLRMNIGRCISGSQLEGNVGKKVKGLTEELRKLEKLDKKLP